MGVRKFMDLVARYAPASKKAVNYSQIAGMSCAIDGQLLLNKFFHRNADHPDSVDTSTRLMIREISLLDIDCVFVFDSDTPTKAKLDCALYVRSESRRIMRSRADFLDKTASTLVSTTTPLPETIANAIRTLNSPLPMPPGATGASEGAAIPVGPPLPPISSSANARTPCTGIFGSSHYGSSLGRTFLGASGERPGRLPSCLIMENAPAGAVHAELVREADRLRRMAQRPTSDMRARMVRLLGDAGMPVVVAPSEVEGEQVCAALAYEGAVDAAVTDDTDALIFYPVRVVRSFLGPLMHVVDGEMLRGDLGVSAGTLVDIAISLGCDYAPKVAGLGPVRAYELLKQHESLECLFDAAPRYAQKGPSANEIASARSVFTNKYCDVELLKRLYDFARREVAPLRENQSARKSSNVLGIQPGQAALCVTDTWPLLFNG